MNTVFRALSDPTRRRVLELLQKRPMTAGELSDEFDVSRPTMSAHFTVLREAGLVVSEKDGKHVVYHLQMSVLEDALLGFARIFGLEPTPKTRDGDSPTSAKPAPPGRK